MSPDRALHALVDAGVEFVLIGGWSAILHGSSLMTNDLDICFSRKRENLRRLVQALTPFHPRLRDLPATVPFVWDEATLRNGTIFTLETDLGPIDLMAEVTGLGTFEDIAPRALTVEAFDRRVRTLDLKSLITAKRAAGR